MSESQPFERTLLFISHAAVDEELALHLKTTLQRVFTGLEGFASSDPEDLPIGNSWIERILEALGRAKLIAVLGTERGLSRKWVWFEAGAGWNERRQIVTCCVGKLRKGALPPPFQLYTALNLDEEQGFSNFLQLICRETGLKTAAVDISSFCQDLIRLDVRAEVRHAFSQKMRARRHFEMPVRNPSVAS